MSLEMWNTLATFGTFLVISATAIAAIIQLRHLRGGNQIAVLNELRETVERPEFVAANQFVSTQLEGRLIDPEFRYQIEHVGARTPENWPLIAHAISIGNFYESMAMLLREGFVDRELALEIWNRPIVRSWKALMPVTSILRRSVGRVLWENFEYLTVLSEDWLAKHSAGTYPPGTRRIELHDAWLDADSQYAASRTAAPSA